MPHSIQEILGLALSSSADNYITEDGSVKHDEKEAVVEFTGGWYEEPDVLKGIGSLPDFINDQLKKKGADHFIRKAYLWRGSVIFRRLSDGAVLKVMCYDLILHIEDKSAGRFVGSGFRKLGEKQVAYFYTTPGEKKVMDFLRESGVKRGIHLQSKPAEDEEQEGRAAGPVYTGRESGYSFGLG